MNIELEEQKDMIDVIKENVEYLIENDVYVSRLERVLKIIEGIEDDLDSKIHSDSTDEESSELY